MSTSWGVLFHHYAIEYKLALIVTGALYAVYCAAILKMGLRNHFAKASGLQVPDTYPPGYFSWLGIQLVPLWITGLALSDSFVVGSRGITLICVVIVYAAINNERGTFPWERYRMPLIVMLATLIVGITAWGEYPWLRGAVQTYKIVTLWNLPLSTFLGWISVAVMAAFFLGGQLPTAKVVRERLEYNYNLKGFGIQWVRLTSFLLQSYYYLYAEGGGWMHPVFLNGAIGTAGALWIIRSYLWGMVFGSRQQRPAIAVA